MLHYIEKIEDHDNGCATVHVNVDGVTGTIHMHDDGQHGLVVAGEEEWEWRDESLANLDQLIIDDIIHSAWYAWDNGLDLVVEAEDPAQIRIVDIKAMGEDDQVYVDLVIDDVVGAMALDCQFGYLRTWGELEHWCGSPLDQFPLHVLLEAVEVAEAKYQEMMCAGTLEQL